MRLYCSSLWVHNLSITIENYTMSLAGTIRNLGATPHYCPLLITFLPHPAPVDSTPATAGYYNCSSGGSTGSGPGFRRLRGGGIYDLWCSQPPGADGDLLASLAENSLLFIQLFKDTPQSCLSLKSRPPKLRPSHTQDQSVSRSKQDRDFEGMRPSQHQDQGRTRPSQDQVLSHI